RRYREIFERAKRKNDDDGVFIEYTGGTPAPIIDIKYPFYAQLEEYVTDLAMKEIREVVDDGALVAV
ncbi:hypothetical protein MXD81_39780, partial [Microbacteriaceae bacterium K1510]|nr:hypothetical protein [Microbacteriaceae bacterium K1510]